MATKPLSKDSKPDARAPAKADPKANAEAEGDEVPPPKKSKKMLIIVAALVLLGGGGGGAWFALKPSATADGKEAAAKAVPAKPPVFIPLEAFTVNLQPDDSAAAQYLQVGLSLKVTEPTLVEAVKLRMPEVRNRVLLLLSSKKASELASPQGKEKLSAELVMEIGKAMGTAEGSSGIASVLFTSFVIQ